MPSPNSTGSPADALRHLGAFASDLVRPTVRLGVTGLAHSGKTVFITALVHNLVAGGRLPFFRAAASGRIAKAYLEPQPDDDVPRFEIEKHLDALTAHPPAWPESTRRISELRVTLEYAPLSLWRHVTGLRRLHLDIVDYPGEWLSDLPLLALDFAQWSRQALTLSREPVRSEAARDWLAFHSALDPDGPADEATAMKGAGLFRAYLSAARGLPGAAARLSPGRFLMPGDLEGSPALTFFPLDEPAQTGAPAASLRAMLVRRYEAYRTRVVLPFFRDHFSRLDRQIVLVDALAALDGGGGAMSDLGEGLEAVLRAFKPGANTWLTSMFARRIGRILFAATKADHVHQSSHDRLEAILARLTQGAIERARFSGAEVRVQAVAAIRATKEARRQHDGEMLPCITGVPMAGAEIAGRRFDGREATAVFPGDLPADPSVALAGGSHGAGFSLVPFRPPAAESGPGGIRAPLPHIRLDRVLDFLIGDRLQ